MGKVCGGPGHGREGEPCAQRMIWRVGAMEGGFLGLSGEGAQSGLWPRITAMWGLMDLANLYISKTVNWVLVNGRTLSMGRREPNAGWWCLGHQLDHM